MRLKDVPAFPAYIVFHDAFDKGAMDIFPCDSFGRAKAIAERKQEKLDNSGQDDCGVWKAYERLPRCKVYKVHTLEHTAVLEKGPLGNG